MAFLEIVAQSPDGQLLLALTDPDAFGGAGAARVFNRETGTVGPVTDAGVELASAEWAWLDATPVEAARLVGVALAAEEAAGVAPTALPTEDGPPVIDEGSGEFTVVLLEESKPTIDGRRFEPGTVGWREPPLSLMYLTQNLGEGHKGARLGGTITEVWREEETFRILGRGRFDSGEDGQELRRLVGDDVLTGVSSDVGGARVELEMGEDGEPMQHIFGGKIMGATVLPFPAFDDTRITAVTAGGDTMLLAVDGDALLPGEQLFAERDGTWVVVDGPALEALGFMRDEECDEDDEECLEEQEDSPRRGGFLRRVLNRDDYGAVYRRAPDAAALVAAAVTPPEEPPAEWFQDPGLTGPTALTVTSDGRVFGHAATWGTCHIGRQDSCLTPPSSRSEYAYFRTGEILCADGARVPVGQITLGTGHAPLQLGARSAAEHYDHTGSVVADVATGEDAHGIWVAGALRPATSPERVRALSCSALSGDWRSIGGGLELVALLAVNTPGFPVPRARAGMEDSRPTSLVAAGVLDPEAPQRTEGSDESDPGPVSSDDIRDLAKKVDAIVEALDSHGIAIGEKEGDCGCDGPGDSCACPTEHPDAEPDPQTLLDLRLDSLERAILSLSGRVLGRVSLAKDDEDQKKDEEEEDDKEKEKAEATADIEAEVEAESEAESEEPVEAEAETEAPEEPPVEVQEDQDDDADANEDGIVTAEEYMALPNEVDLGGAGSDRTEARSGDGVAIAAVDGAPLIRVKADRDGFDLLGDDDDTIMGLVDELGYETVERIADALKAAVSPAEEPDAEVAPLLPVGEPILAAGALDRAVQALVSRESAPVGAGRGALQRAVDHISGK